jgi:arylsulfatase A-like enzyme
MRYPPLILALILALAGPDLAPAAERPNVVVILSDDQGWTDYGFMGHENIKTPHLDKLAQQSVVFERGYVAAPLCRPSLASMVTGRYPFDHGITGNDVDGNKNRAALDLPLSQAFNKLPGFIRGLSADGYLTHQSGKWWEGSFRDGGFTHGMTHGDPKRGGRHGDAGLVIGREGLKPISDFLDLAVTEKKPFLLWYAPFLPHTPHNPPRRLLDKYSAPGRPADVARYFAMCEWFDETCGDLLGQLDRRGLRENTLVIYLCDNGWAATSTNAADPNQKLWKGYALRSKSSPYETGIRTPILLSWPGRIEPGRSQDLAHAIDLFPTIAAATGIAAPKDLPGIDLLDAKARQERDTVFGVCHSVHNMTPGNPDGALQYLWCISGDWKLLVRHDGEDTTDYKNIHLWDKQPVRLYHLKDDPHEKNELSSAHPEIVEKLRKKIEAWHPVVVK